MKTLILSAVTLLMMVVPALASDGYPGCRPGGMPFDDHPMFGPPPGGPRFGRSWDPMMRSPRFASCDCSTCDPWLPCSPHLCFDQDCEDFETFAPTAPLPRRTVPRRDVLPPPPAVDPPAEPPTRAMPSTATAAPRLPLGGQKFCPVTGEELISMGKPLPVRIANRTIFVCCDSCVAAVKRNPQKYFAIVDRELAGASSSKLQGSKSRPMNAVK